MQKHRTWSEIHLDALRGLAALIVAFGHARGLFLSSLTDTSAAAATAAQGTAAPTIAHLTIGHQAVMVFFVLSGYLVGGSVLKSLANDRWQWSDYLVKRLARLWTVLIPAIIIGLLLDTIGFHLLAQPGSLYTAPVGQQYILPEYLTRGVDLWTALGNMFFLQGIVVSTSGTNIALWSLSNEFWYYLLFPLCMLVFHRNVTLVRRIVFSLIAAGIAVMIGADTAFLFLVWLLGAVVATTPPRISSRLAGKVVAVAGLVFVAAFLTLKKCNLPLYASEMLLGILTALLIYAIKCQNTTAQVSLYSKTSRFFSDISYTLYLTHLPFLIFVCALVNSPWKKWTTSPLMLIAFIAVSSLSIVWAWLLYCLFESRTDKVRQLGNAIVTKCRGKVLVDIPEQP